MKIRSITLDNIRRFTDPVTVGPIGDGVTLLCEPNEAGKSTLFDALHALFFLPHRSVKAVIKSLQPHSGGKIAVECELVHDGSDWRIRKEWLSGASAKVWRGGTLVHQDDAAEEWIARLVSGKSGGPGGLLWVRQGRVSLQAPEANAEKKEHAERRDLLTAISGAMDDVTGGERMDQARIWVDEELKKYQTPTGRMTGLWKDAENAVDDLTAKEAELRRVVDQLRDDLDTRRRHKERLAELENTELAEKRRADLAAAEAALREAEGLAKDRDAAEARAKLAKREADAAREEAARRASVRNEASEADRALHKAQARHEAAALKAKETRDALEKAKSASAGLKDGLAEAETLLRRIDEADRAAADAAERRRLAESLAKAEAAEAERVAAKAAAKSGPDDATVTRVEALARDLDARTRARDAAAPRVEARYEPGAAKVIVAGTPLNEGETRPLPPDGAIEVPGIGSLRISARNEGSAEAVENARAALAEALAEGPWANLTQVHEAARRRSDALRKEALAEGTRDLHAPDGIDTLRETLASLGEAVLAARDDLPKREHAEWALAEARAALVEADAKVGSEQEHANAANVEAGRAEEALAEARRRAEKARAGVEDLGPDDETASEQLGKLDRAAEAAAAEFARIEKATPDVDRLRAHRDRLKSVVEQASAETVRLKTEIGTLDGRIETRAEKGVEEQLAEVRDRLSAARDALGRINFEVAVLRRLRDALDTAKSAARDTYFEPIKAEMQPLLRDLWDDVDVEWSDDTLLPARLVRRGTAEPIDVLSGGTQEQIAFFVRLAFARLLAKAGRPAPLILDDALVYSDDDRIERMFDALHRTGGDLQIIVLSCRQRAFRDLGAPTLTFKQVEAA